jgi:asparagine synthase (glutamine-hydrolysing)
VPIAAQLSGGLDSTLVAGLLHRELGSSGRPEADLRLCAMVYPDHPEADEREWIERASSFLGRRAELCLPRSPGAADFAEWARTWRDFPPYPGDLECDRMMQLASDSGARVMFTGNGGDDWFWGVEGVGWATVRRLAAASGPTALRRAARAMVGALVRATMPRGVLRSVRRLRRPSWRWIPDTFSRRTDLADRVTVRPRTDLDPRVPGSAIAAKLDDGFLIHGREIAERYAAAWQFEERHPLYDRRVIEFAASLPGDQLYRDGRHRFVLRGAAHGLVPEEIRIRSSKAEFSHIVTEALLQPDVVRALGSLAIADAGWVRGDQVATMLAEVETLYQNGATGYTRWAWPLWMVFGIETWYRAVFLPDREHSGSR